MNIKKNIWTLIVTLVICVQSFALSVPELRGPIVDNANLLSPSEYQELDENLRTLSSETGSQIAVLTIPSLEDENLEDYSMKVAETWKLGSNKQDDGLLILVAFKEKKIRIEVGYGFEQYITDTKAGLIIRNVIAPQFQKGNYGQGIIDGVYAVESVIGYKESDVAQQLEENQSEKNSINPIIIFLIIYFMIFTGMLSRKFPILNILPWVWLFSGRSGGHSSHSSHHNGFGGGSSFGGGGFSGGGGGFGGGGASGGW